MSLKRNVIVNYLGQGWVAVMGLAFVPIYIRYLGIESYGLIGLFAAFQTWLTLLDVGMTPTLGREMARFTANEHSAQSINDLLCSVEVVCFGVAISVCVAMWAGSNWIATDWLRTDLLTPGIVRKAIGIMSLVIAFRFVESIYRSALFGLQRQVWYNIANAGLSTARAVGAVVVLAFFSPTIISFFLWQAFISMVSLATFALAVHQSLPNPPSRPAFSHAALLRVWRFAGGMSVITLLATALTQVDKILLSRLLSLESFGYYTLAATVAGSLYLLITPITTAVFPRLVEIVSHADGVSEARVYHRAAQLVTFVTAPSALLLAFFGEGVIFTWSGNATLAHGAGPLLAALALGNFLNGLMYVPYQLQLAHAWTSLTLGINFVAVCVLLPVLFWIVPRYGALGAAWVWIALNIAYVLIDIQFMHRRILPAEKWGWYVRDVGAPTFSVACTFLALHAIQPEELTDRLAWLRFLVFALSAATSVSILSNRDLRFRLLLSMRRVGEV